MYYDHFVIRQLLQKADRKCLKGTQLFSITYSLHCTRDNIQHSIEMTQRNLLHPLIFLRQFFLMVPIGKHFTNKWEWEKAWQSPVRSAAASESKKERGRGQADKVTSQQANIQISGINGHR